MNPLKGELEYGSISLDDKEDYRLYRYSDAGMGETEYRIFRNGAFFAMFDTRKDAEEVMTVMTHKSELEKVLDEIFPKNPDVLHTGWVYKKELRERLEFRIMERNEWGLGEEEIEEVLMVFEEQLRQSKQDGDREP